MKDSEVYVALDTKLINVVSYARNEQNFSKHPGVCLYKPDVVYEGKEPFDSRIEMCNLACWYLKPLDGMFGVFVNERPYDDRPFDIEKERVISARPTVSLASSRLIEFARQYAQEKVKKYSRNCEQNIPLRELGNLQMNLERLCLEFK